MKHCVLFLIGILTFFFAQSQEIPIETFRILEGKQISDIDDVLTKVYRCAIDEIIDDKGVYSWKKGFNGDHSRNNQVIFYKTNDSTYEFWFGFYSELYADYGKKVTYYDYYENELNSGKYKRLNDTIEDWGYKAIVKNYQYGLYTIKLGKLGSTDSNMIKIIKL